MRAKRPLLAGASPAAVAAVAPDAANSGGHVTKETETAFSALLAAAAMLPIVMLPVNSEAQVAEQGANSSMLPVGATMGMRVLYYRESGDRMKVTEPVVWLKTPVADVWEISLSGTLDIVSGASPEIVSNRSGTPVQILSGASGAITDRRQAGDFAIKRKFGEHTIGVTRSILTEDDYTSYAAGANATFDFNDRNTTFALGYGKSNDRVRSTIDATLNARRDTRDYLLGITQLLDRNALVQSNLTRTIGKGYYDDPYRFTQSLFRNGQLQSLSLIPDTRPASRAQWAWLTRFKRSLPEQRAVVTAEYRYFTDDWGIRAHTLYGSWLQTASEFWKWEIGLRYYSQRQADFYRPEVLTRPTPMFTSSDQRIAGFGALEPSVKLIVQLTDGMSLDCGVSMYRQQGNWKIGGGTPSFQPLQAVLLNVGLVHRF